jgi:hypothetical protein
VKEKEVHLEVRPVDMVADAMMVALYKQTEKMLALDNTETLKEVLFKATKEKCRLGSAMVVAYLQDNCPKYFPVKLVIEAVDPYGLTMIDGWGWHDYFLVLGKDGFWYAGSPANFGRSKKGSEVEEKATNLIYSKSLPYVINKIRYLEGGEWPEAGEIYKIIDREFDDERVVLFEDKGEKAVNFLLVSHETSGTFERRISVRLNEKVLMER